MGQTHIFNDVLLVGKTGMGLTSIQMLLDWKVVEPSEPSAKRHRGEG